MRCLLVFLFFLLKIFDVILIRQLLSLFWFYLVYIVLSLLLVRFVMFFSIEQFLVISCMLLYLMLLWIIFMQWFVLFGFMYVMYGLLFDGVFVVICLRIGLMRLYVLCWLLGMIDGLCSVFFLLFDMLVLMKCRFDCVSFWLWWIVLVKCVLLLLISMLFFLSSGLSEVIVVLVVFLVFIIIRIWCGVLSDVMNFLSVQVGIRLWLGNLVISLLVFL